MTSTPQISGQTIGSGANKGDGLFPQKLTVQTTTTAFIITPRVTNGNGPYVPQAEVIVYYSSSAYSITAANGPLQLGQTSRYVAIKPGSVGGQVIIRDSLLEPLTGGFIYLWVSAPTLPNDATLDVTVTEWP